MVELIPVKRVLHSVLIYDELVYIQDPLYRDERRRDIMTVSMANHRTYCNKIMSYHTEIDVIQEWIIGLTSLLYSRLDRASSSLANNQLIRKSAIPECLNEELRLYRENLLKLLS